MLFDTSMAQHLPEIAPVNQRDERMWSSRTGTRPTIKSSRRPRQTPPNWSLNILLCYQSHRRNACKPRDFIQASPSQTGPSAQIAIVSFSQILGCRGFVCERRISVWLAFWANVIDVYRLTVVLADFYPQFPLFRFGLSAFVSAPACHCALPRILLRSRHASLAA